jgi:hypothetical protein
MNMLQCKLLQCKFRNLFHHVAFLGTVNSFYKKKSTQELSRVYVPAFTPFPTPIQCHWITCMINFKTWHEKGGKITVICRNKLPTLTQVEWNCVADKWEYLNIWHLYNSDFSIMCYMKSTGYSYPVLRYDVTHGIYCAFSASIFLKTFGACMCNQRWKSS